MNKESLILCVQAAQKGDRQALEQLLLYAYGIVDYQCRKLLPTAPRMGIGSCCIFRSWFSFSNAPR